MREIEKKTVFFEKTTEIADNIFGQYIETNQIIVVIVYHVLAYQKGRAVSILLMISCGCGLI
uniref:Uncharacterized protein n=1 Tax=Manihot esculenta TaxID=3983 RepID=A0A2C9UQ70_MANES